MSIEQWILLALSTATATGGTIWATVKFVIPKLVDARIKSNQDEREHRQKMEDRERTYHLLQDSWQEDKLAALLEEDHAFIRDAIHGQLAQILQAVNRLEYTTSQARDALAVLAAESSRDRRNDNETKKQAGEMGQEDSIRS